MGRKALALVALGATLALTACTGQGAGPVATGEPVSGGTLEVALNVDPNTLDPAQSTFTVTRQIFDSLLSQDPETGELLPWLAESWEVNDDSTEFTFTLREGVTFSNGTVLDAEAVKANFDAIVESKVSPVTYFPGYAGTTVVDPLTFTVAFEQPNSGFLQATTMPQLGIREPSTVIGKSPEERKDVDGIIGSGPFTVAEYIRDQEILLERRDGYAWAAASSENQGEAYLDAIHFQIVPENSVRTGLVRSGQVHIDSVVAPVDEAGHVDAGLNLVSLSLPGLVQGMFPNTSSPKLSDEAVRQALQIAINRQEIVDTVLSESYLPATNVLASNTPGYADHSDLLAYDPDAAEALLDGAGWVKGADGIRAKDGVVLNFDVYYLPNTSFATDTLELVQQQLAQVGLGLTLHQTPMDQFLQTLASGEFDFTSGNATRSDPDVMRSMLAPTAGDWLRLAEDGSLSQTLISIASTTDIEARNQVADEAVIGLIESGSVIPLHEFAMVVASTPDVGGLALDATSRPDYYSVWLAA